MKPIISNNKTTTREVKQHPSQVWTEIIGKEITTLVARRWRKMTEGRTMLEIIENIKKKESQGRQKTQLA